MEQAMRSEDTRQSRSIDSEISIFLDWIGFSQEEISWRRKVWKDVDILHSIIWRSSNAMVHSSGSRPEGTGINALGADIDMMYSVPEYRIIHDYKDWKHLPKVYTLLLNTTGLHPGYCRLLLMYTDAPIVVEARDLPPISSPKVILVAHNGVIVVSNNLGVHPDEVRNGPAHTKDMAGTGGLDSVACIPTAFPAEAREWVDRDRPSNFPPQEFFRESARRDTFVVGTGYKKSKNPDLEWRFSFSLIELEIVRMWAHNVTRCYILLKMLKKHISSLLPHLSDIISSYHLKTLLFWLTEQTGLQFWERSSVGECLMFSLERLLLWVERGHIPHYFIKDNNLFDLHAGTTRQRDVAAVLRDMITQGPAWILHCEYYKNLSPGMKLTWVDCRSLHVQKERVYLHTAFALCTTRCIEYRYSSDQHKSMGTLFNALDVVQIAIPRYDSDVEKGLGYMRAELRCTLATRVLSMSLQNRMSNITRHLVIKISEQLLKGSRQEHVGQLKLANFYYQTRQYKLATNVLKVLVEMDLFRIIRFDVCRGGCRCQERHLQALASTESPAEVLSNNASVSLLFKLPEIHAAPDALKFGMFKPQLGFGGEDSVLEHADMCSVDPLAFVYYLQYLCYDNMEKTKHAEVAFDNLQWVAKQEDRIHRDTTWNILGHCFYKQGKLRQAVSCLVESLRIQPFRSVALVQLALVIKSAFAQHNVQPV